MSTDRPPAAELFPFSLWPATSFTFRSKKYYSIIKCHNAIKKGEGLTDKRSTPENTPAWRNDRVFSVQPAVFWSVLERVLESGSGECSGAGTCLTLQAGTRVLF